MRLFQAALDTCLDSPLLCQPLSSRFALHGLRAFDLPRAVTVTPTDSGETPAASAIRDSFPQKKLLTATILLSMVVDRTHMGLDGFNRSLFLRPCLGTPLYPLKRTSPRD